MLEDTRTVAKVETLSAFVPRSIDFKVAGRTHQFMLATPEGEQWYDPAKPHAMLEYEWVAANVKLAGETVYDIGSHHGHYALVLAAERPRKLVCIDAVAANGDVTTVNLARNGFSADVKHLAISTRDGHVEFTAESNGRVVDRGVHRVPSARLPSIAADATVIKLDIEGEEFRVLPDQIDQLPSVHTWIIEIHPWKTRDPLTLMPLLQARFSDIQWVNKAAVTVEPYPADADWSSHTTVICRKKKA